MAVYPSGLTTKVVTGSVDPGTSVRFRIPKWLVGPVDDMVYAPRDLVPVVDASGAFTIALPATDDPEWTPFQYRVYLKDSGGLSTEGAMDVPLVASSYNLADLLILEQPEASTLVDYLDVSDIGSRVAGLVDGAVPSAQLPATTNLPNTGPSLLVRRLRTGLLPCSMLLLGDSTGNETTEWFYGLTSYLAGHFPDYRTTYRLWNDTTQGYDAPVTVGVGAGVDRYATIVASSSQNLQCPDSAATSPTGDMSVRCRIRLTDWTPSSTTDIAGKIGSAGNRTWWLSVTTSGAVQFNWSTDGTATGNKTSSVSAPFADGVTGWIRADFATASGNVTFYTAPDATSPTWTQLGTVQTGAGVTALFDSTSTTQFVGRTGGTWTATGGRAYAMQVYNGTALVIDLDMGVLPGQATTLTDYTGNVWTVAGAPAITGDLTFAVFNASVAGTNISYANDSTRFPKLTTYPADVSFVSYGHNEGTGVTYSGYPTLIAALLAKWTTTGIVPVLQNPELSPNTQAHIDSHAQRMDVVAALAMAGRWPVVDVYRAISDDPRGVAALTLDGTHPNALGTEVWLAAAEALFPALV